MSEKQYKVITSTNVEDFETKVTAHLNDGWELHGSMNHFASEGNTGTCIYQHYSQAVVKLG